VADCDEDDMFKLLAGAVKRLEIRIHLATLIKVEAQRRKEANLAFDITSEIDWK